MNEHDQAWLKNLTMFYNFLVQCKDIPSGYKMVNDTEVYLANWFYNARKQFMDGKLPKERLKSFGYLEILITDRNPVIRLQEILRRNNGCVPPINAEGFIIDCQNKAIKLQEQLAKRRLQNEKKKLRENKKQARMINRFW